MQRRASAKEAEKAYKKANRSPFIKYCVTVVASLLVAGTVFTCLLFTTDFFYDSKTNIASYRIATTKPSVVTVTTIVEVVKTQQSVPDDSSLLAGIEGNPADSQGNQQTNPSNPGDIPSPDIPYTPGQSYTLSETQQYIYNFFKNKGYNDIAIAGMFGNMQQEHNFDPSYSSNGRIGFIQWGSDRKTNLESGQWSGGYAPDTVEAQCNFIWAEINREVPGYGYYYDTCNPEALNDPVATCQRKGWYGAGEHDAVKCATYIFARVYEGCTSHGGGGDLDSADYYYQEFNERNTYAQNAYASFGH